MTPPPGLALRGSFWLGDTALFRDLSVTLAAGEWTCLLGPSGVGKSTLLRILLGLETGGRFDGEIAASDGVSVAGRLAYMAQSDLLMPWLSLEENVLLGGRLRGERPARARARDLIARVGLAGHEAARPHTLSGGMRQRAALARTLMEDRPVVLLDEPFSALDAGTRARMQELAFEVLAGRTVCLVTHDPAEACRLGHHIGCLTAQGVESWPPPATPPLRLLDDPLALETQTALLARLREVAA